GMHAYASFCGGPQIYSNDFLRFADRMHFLPDRRTVARWLRRLAPRCAVPYAAFTFFNERSAARVTGVPGPAQAGRALSRFFNESLNAAERRRIGPWREDPDAL